MSKLFHVAVALFLLGKWQHLAPLVNMSYFLGVVWIILLSIRCARVGLFAAWHHLMEKVRNRSRQKQDANARARELRDEIERERVKSENQLEIYKQQAEMMIKFKARGADIERNLFEIRRKLLELESNENGKMIQEILQTLNEV